MESFLFVTVSKNLYVGWMTSWTCNEANDDPGPWNYQVLVLSIERTMPVTQNVLSIMNNERLAFFVFLSWPFALSLLLPVPHPCSLPQVTGPG